MRVTDLERESVVTSNRSRGADLERESVAVGLKREPQSRERAAAERVERLPLGPPFEIGSGALPDLLSLIHFFSSTSQYHILYSLNSFDSNMVKMFWWRTEY